MKAKHTFSHFLLYVLIVCLIMNMFVPIHFLFIPVYANTVQTSFTSLGADGYLRMSAAKTSWGTAFDAASADFTSNTTSVAGLQGGRRVIGSTAYIMRSAVFFNITGLPNGTAVSSLILSLNFTLNTATNAYVMSVYTPETAYVYPTLALPLSDYNYQYYDSSAEVGSIASGSISLNAYNNITLSTGAANLTAVTRLILRTESEATNSTWDLDNEYWNAAASEWTNSPPKLYISYSVPAADNYGTDVTYAGYNVTFYSHWATDASANLTTASYANFTWNGTGTTETTANVALSNGWFNYSRITPSTVGVVVQYSFSANDSLGRSGSTGNINLTLTTAMWTLIKETDATIGYDDVFQNSTSYYKTTQTLQLGYDGTSGANVSLKFAGYNNSQYLGYLQRGAHLDNATLQFRGNTSASGNNPYVRLQACTALSDIKSASWSNIGASTFARTKTTAYVDWQLPDTTAGTDISSPNFASVIQELVNLGDWTIGGNISLFLMFLNGTGQRFFNAQETGQSETYARLYLEWDWTPQIVSYSTNVTIACNRTIAYAFNVFNYRSLQYGIYEWNATASFVNSTAFAITAGTYPFYWANFSANMGTEDLWHVNLTLFYNETVGGVWYGRDPEYTLKPLYGYYNSSNLGIVSYSSAQLGFAHNTGRHIYYDNNTASYIAFFSNGSSICYAFSLDGVTWQNQTAFISDGGLGDHSYQYVRNLQGISYIDVQFGNEGVNTNYTVYYRRGQIEANHSITWHAAWQTVYAPAAGIDTYPEAVITDSQNITYLVIENATHATPHDNMTMLLYKNSVTDGTWSSAGGFPLNITSHDTGLWESIPLLYANDTIAFVMTTGENDYGPETSFTGYVEVWYYNGTTTWYENASDTAAKFRDCSGALLDNSGLMHIVYKDSNDQLRYVWKNSSGIWQPSQLIWDEETGGPDASLFTIPQLTYDSTNNRLFSTWYSNETYLYVSYRAIGVGNNWLIQPKRISDVPASKACNTAIERSNGTKILFGMQSASPYTLYTYYYDLTTVWIPLSESYSFFGTASFTSVMSSQNALGYSFQSSSIVNSLLGFGKDLGNAFSSGLSVLSNFQLNKEAENLFASILGPTSLLCSNNAFGLSFISTGTFSTVFGRSIELSNAFSNTLQPLSLLSSNKALGFLQASTASLSSVFLPFKELSTSIVSTATVSSLLESNKELGLNFLSTATLSSQLQFPRSLLFSFEATSFFSSLFSPNNALGFNFASTPSFTSLLQTNNALGLNLLSTSALTSTVNLNQEFQILFTSTSSLTSLFTTNKQLGFPLISTNTFTSLFRTAKELGFPFQSTVSLTSNLNTILETLVRNDFFNFISTANVASNLASFKELMFSSSSTLQPYSLFQSNSGLGFTFSSTPSLSSLFASNKGLGFSFTSSNALTSFYTTTKELAFPFQSTITITSLLASFKEAEFSLSSTIQTISLSRSNTALGFTFSSSPMLSSLFMFNKELGFSFQSTTSILSLCSSGNELAAQLVSVLSTSTATLTSQLTLNLELGFTQLSTVTVQSSMLGLKGAGFYLVSVTTLTSTFQSGKELLLPFTSTVTVQSLLYVGKEIATVFYELTASFTGNVSLASLFTPLRDYIGQGWGIPLEDYSIVWIASGLMLGMIVTLSIVRVRRREEENL